MIQKNLLLCALVLAIGGADAAAQSINKWPICGRAKRITCIVDGDTFWMDRVKYRLQGVGCCHVNWATVACLTVWA